MQIIYMRMAYDLLLSIRRPSVFVFQLNKIIQTVYPLSELQYKINVNKETI